MHRLLARVERRLALQRLLWRPLMLHAAGLGRTGCGQDPSKRRLLIVSKLLSGSAVSGSDKRRLWPPLATLCLRLRPWTTRAWRGAMMCLLSLGVRILCGLCAAHLRTALKR